MRVRLAKEVILPNNDTIKRLAGKQPVKSCKAEKEYVVI